MLNKKNTIVIICGPTAVGKTAIAIQLAQHFNTKIISADSRQCFKELNIGVAKPSIKELNEVPHFFINSHSIQEEVNAITFEKYALEKAIDIFGENTIAIMVGGTGLYIKAFCEGLDNIPNIPENIRTFITEQYTTHGLVWLQQQVQEKDAAFWQSAEQKNPHRLIRALEVIEATGKSINTFRRGGQVQRPFNIIKIGLQLPRENLYQQINDRVDAMINTGLVDEVKSLRPYQQLNALQTVGYKEIFNYLNDIYSLPQAIEEIKKNTRHYAKRQMTWFKKDVSIKWFAPNDSNEMISFLNEKSTQ